MQTVPAYLHVLERFPARNVQKGDSPRENLRAVSPAPVLRFRRDTQELFRLRQRLRGAGRSGSEDKECTRAESNERSGRRYRPARCAAAEPQRGPAHDESASAQPAGDPEAFETAPAAPAGGTGQQEEEAGAPMQ